ncbi:YhcH/YjgK/YiaL family protein [Fusobacterium varium]|uniref:YhcH/YjgK/YiaL family protein n=1 Tax=Fusobacterium varium TaxID=856 RepID=UPI003566F913
MIFDTLENLKNYKGISVNFDKAVESIMAGDYLNAFEGRHDVDGDNVYFNVQEDLLTREVSETCFESHQKYIDIQLIVDGEEKFGYSARKVLKERNNYDSEKDYDHLDGEIEVIYKMTKDRFILFFPLEPHMPCLKVGEKKKIKKAVYKIKI